MTSADDPEILGSWVGRSRSITDVIDAGRAAHLHDTLGTGAKTLARGWLPLLWYWAHFLETVPIERIGPDGHPERGDFLPPVSLPRRMWAGSRVEQVEPLRLGDAATKISTIVAVTPKEGRSGPLCFVTVHHEIEVDGELRIREEQDIVYRGPAHPDEAATVEPASPPPPRWSRTIEPSAVLLFRYSALTLNAHRIHYDRDYSRDVEGYPGLVVHGPLLASLMAGLAEDEQDTPPRTFQFRARSPVFDDAPVVIAGSPDTGGIDLWAGTPTTPEAMTARATFG